VNVNPTFMIVVGKHQVVIERIDKQLWKVTIDGRRHATYCTESRARAAGRQEAKRLGQRR
jgi:hypothetical protein